MTFPEFCLTLGIIVPPDLIPGKWTDCATLTHRKKKGRVKLEPDGRIGFAIDYISMTEVATWHIDGQHKLKERTAEDNAILSRKLAAKRAEEKKGIVRANALYGRARALLHGDHEYLRRKMLDMNGCRHLRIDEKGWLLVPMFRDGRVISVQRISPEGEKRFMAGAPTKWTQFRIHRSGSAITILCEGLATGLTIFAAITTADVIVCFSAANLVAVAEREYWEGMVAVASDNDWETICLRHWQDGEINVFDPEQPRPEWCRCNPGKTNAMKSASRIGCGYATPPGPGTDWNDALISRLSELQKADESASRPKNPMALRHSALVPIASEIMRAVRPVKKN